MGCYTCVYREIERERERKRQKRFIYTLDPGRGFYMCVSIYVDDIYIYIYQCYIWLYSHGRRGGGLGSRPIFKKFNEPYAPS